MNTDRNHLDAETVAAWMDGGLDSASLAAAEAHASNCERCQALLASVAKTMPENQSAVVSGFSRMKWWLAPLAATAAAVTIWMVVPQEQLQEKATTGPPAEVVEPAAARARDEAAAQPKPQATPPPAADRQFSEGKRKAAAPAANVADARSAKARQNKEERLDRAEAAPAPARVAAAPAAPPPAAATAAPAAIGAAQESAAVNQLRKQTAPLVIVSPDPRFRWRASSEGIEFSQDGGRTWLPVRLPQGEVITAGAAPAPLVCWLVGRSALILVATDGTNFTRIPFPERVDLIAISSSELRIATVTTADGRVFHTENAGRTWQRQQ